MVKWSEKNIIHKSCVVTSYKKKLNKLNNRINCILYFTITLDQIVYVNIFMIIIFIVGNLDMFSLISQSDIVSINDLTQIRIIIDQ